ncbi:IS3 family transposase [Streptomyces sp. P01-B04]|uniref:IS3 family transposase n=1 Tax=Streptomyces poriferorum TaxID=2798799 RepID=UPI001C5E4BDC|nr:IS3 family transposase [Streptomyces poriferorum]MBW5259596.1 IS3 family transposase [Streptomyces poriferorum]
MTVHPFIEAEKRAGHSVTRACELLKVSRTAFYARRSGLPGPRAVRDDELTEQITEVHARSRGTYGAPRVHAVLAREGAGCGRRRVARRMRAAGLQGRHGRRRQAATIPDPTATFRPDLIVRHFQPDRTGLDTRWCGDITYIPTDEGWLYLATVIDIASRRVVGWANTPTRRTRGPAHPSCVGIPSCGRPAHPGLGQDYSNTRRVCTAPVEPELPRRPRTADHNACPGLRLLNSTPEAPDGESPLPR